MSIARFFRNLLMMVITVNALMYLAIVADVAFYPSKSTQQRNWEKVFNSISAGQAKSEVLKALGKPAREDNNEWVYTCPGYGLTGKRWCIGTVSFDEFERVIGHAMSAPNSLEMFR